MGEWLGMPKALRTENSKTIVKCWKAGTPTTLADAFASYRGDRVTARDTALIAKARSGDKTAMLDLWTKFISSANDTKRAEDNAKGVDSFDKKTSEVTISDPETQAKLEYARTQPPSDRPTLYSALYADLEGMVNAYKGTMLFAGQKPGSSIDAQYMFDLSGHTVVTVTLPVATEQAPATGSYGEQAPTNIDDIDADEGLDEADRVQTQWQSLADTIRGSAERIWRDLFLDPTADLKHAAPKMSLESIARTSQLLMLLWLETALYQDRAYSNYTGRSMASAKGESTRKSIQKYVTEYHDTLQRWDEELRRLMSAYKVKTYFCTHRLESQQFRRLIRQFGNLNAEELGWASQVSDAEAELRYQQRDVLRREFGADKNPLGFMGMLILRVTTGYGTKPLNFLWTTLAVWGVDALAFFLNDYFHKIVYQNGMLSVQHFCATSQPHLYQWQDYILEALRYLYIAITNLTSLGINQSLATYCGGAISEIAVLATTLLGYFMLGLLSAVLYTQLTQRD